MQKTKQKNNNKYFVVSRNKIKQIKKERKQKNKKNASYWAPTA